jgi:O-antigen/teichoic acid export membrane protein
VEPLSHWKRKFVYRIKGEMALALIRTFIARGIAALGSLLFIVVLGRLYGPEGVGAFALAQSIILGAATLARYGMDNALLRFVGENPTSKHTLTYLAWAGKKTVWLSLVAALVILFGRELLELVFRLNGLSDVLVGIAIATPAFTLSFILSGFMKGVRKPATACMLENGSISLLAGTVVLALYWLAPSVGIASVGWAYAIAAWIIVSQGFFQLVTWKRKQDFKIVEPISRQDFSKSSQAFFVTSLATFMQAVVSIWIAGIYLDSNSLGMFKAAQQTALLINFILIVINAIFPPRFAKLYRDRDYRALSRLARQGALLGTILAMPLLFICLVAPQWMLGWAGEEFEQAAILLRIIAVAQLVNVTTGSVGFLLNMTGYENLMRNIALVTNLTGVFLFVLLIPIFNELGAALALASVLIMQNIIALLFVWRRLGIWMMPMPNLFRIAGVTTKHPVD